MKLFSQVEPAELFAQHSTEKVVAVSFIYKVLLEIHDPRELLSGKKFWIPSVISSVQLKKEADQFWFLAHSDIFQGRRWEVSKHVLCLCWKRRREGVWVLSAIEWDFRSLTSLIFGDGHGRVSRDWATSYTGLTPTLHHCLGRMLAPPELWNLHQFHNWHNPPCLVPHLFPLVSYLPQTFKPLSSSKWATAKTTNAIWAHSQSSNSFLGRYVISTMKFLSLKILSLKTWHLTQASIHPDGEY